MSSSEYIAIFSVITVVTGWFINGHLNRKLEITKRRFDYRMTILHKFLDVQFFVEKNSNPFSDPDFLPLIENTRKNILLYGENDEIELFELFIRSCEQGDAKRATDALNDMTSLVRKKIRKELDIK